MIKAVKIGEAKVKVKYKDLSDTDKDAFYDPVKNEIIVDKALDEDHDKNLVHEMVHAISQNTSLLHTSITPDLWEVLAHEISEAIGNNFDLTKKRACKKISR